MITIEFLNAIEGRPFPIGEWKQYIDEITGEPGHFYTEDDMESNWQGTNLAVLLRSVELTMSDVPVSTALEIATYARRVEIEVERARNPGLPRLTEGNFAKGEFPSDDVDTILVRVSYSVNWLHWSRFGASWRDVWSDRARYKLLGPWRLETAK